LKRVRRNCNSSALYKEHIEGPIRTAMRGLDPRTGIAPASVPLASAMVCLPGQQKFGTREGLIDRLPHAGSDRDCSRAANDVRDLIKEETHA
jgi:hypothetical protein